MQSIPAYYSPTYPPPSPYPTTTNITNTTAATPTTATTTTTSSPGNGSTVMTISNPPLLATPNGMTPLEQTMLRNTTTSPENATVKRNQVKNACTNCQKACKKCDDARPCPRCIKYGISDTCINSVRKERKKGIKRGPYKRRQKSNDDTKSGSGEKLEQYNTLRTDTATATPTTTTTTTTSDAAVAAAAAAVVVNGTHPADYGYPSNLTQYAQSYDAFHYAATATAVYNNAKDQQQQQQQHQQQQQQQDMSSHVYIVTPSYPTFPVANGNNTNTNEDNATNHAYFHQLLGTNQQNLTPATGVYYQNEQTTELKQEKQNQPMTPVPSTSNSSGTTSPSEIQDDDESSKFARLTQLCSAALRENKEAEAAAASKQQAQPKEEEK